MKLFFCVFFCISFVFCNAQNDFEKKLDSVLAIEDQDVKIQFLENFKKNHKEENTKLYAKLYHKLGVEYYRKDEYVKALQNVQKAISIKRTIPNYEIQDLHRSLNLRLTCYKYLGDVSKELEDLYVLANATEYTKYKLIALLKLADFHNEIGDYFKAIEYSDRIINSYSLHENEEKLVEARLKKIGTYAFMGSNDSILLNDIEYNRRELKRKFEEKKELFDDYDEMLFHNNSGIIYRGFQNREQALISYQKALDNFFVYDTTDSISTINKIYVNIGEMYSQLGESEKAKENYQKVLLTTDSINISAVSNNWGYYHATSVEEEIKFHQKAIQLLGINKNLFGTTSFIEAIKDSPYKGELLSVLIDLSQAWVKLYNENKNTEHLQNSLETLYVIDDLISLMRLDSATKASKFFWISRGVNSYLEAVKICYLLDKPAEAFYFMEKNKSLYLLEQLGKLQLKNEYEIPSRLLDRQVSLSYEKFLANNKLKKNPENTSFQNTFDKISRKYFKFTDSLINIFPEYYESNLKPQLTSLNEFQDFLRERSTGAIEYILGENEGYGLWINENEIQFFKLEEYSTLLHNINSLKQMLKPSLSKEEVSQYQKIGFDVFNSLFPFENGINQLKGNKLAIIPDGVLYNFNFEVLIVDQNPVLKDNFLINKTEVSYLNSASVSRNLYDQKAVDSHSYLGITPVEFDSETLIDLKNSEEITKEISTLFSSSLLAKEKATRDNFLNTSKESMILHLNTHAGIDDKTKIPWLALHDTLISLEEVYTSNRSHHLVFLDACKTGDGKLQKGEGIESLSKAFFHSGTKSVIASQWNANEKATNAISLSFFEELQKGSTKSFALRKAKLDYLNNNELSNTFPYFWASLTLTGNSDTLPAISYRLYYWVFIAGVLFIVIFLYNRKRRRNSKR